MEVFKKWLLLPKMSLQAKKVVKLTASSIEEFVNDYEDDLITKKEKP